MKFSPYHLFDNKKCNEWQEIFLYNHNILWSCKFKTQNTKKPEEGVGIFSKIFMWWGSLTKPFHYIQTGI